MQTSLQHSANQISNVVICFANDQGSRGRLLRQQANSESVFGEVGYKSRRLDEKRDKIRGGW